MAAMLRSALAGLALRRSSARARLPSCLPVVSFSDNTTAGSTVGRRTDESNKESPGAKDKKKKAITKRKATQDRPTSSDDLDDLYLTTHFLNFNRHGSKTASSVAVPPDHRDEHDPFVMRGSSIKSEGSTTTRDSSWEGSSGDSEGSGGFSDFSD